MSYSPEQVEECADGYDALGEPVGASMLRAYAATLRQQAARVDEGGASLAEQSAELASDMAYEANQQNSQELADRAALVQRLAIALSAQPAEGLAGEVAAMRDAVGACRDGIQARIAELEAAQPAQAVDVGEPDAWAWRSDGMTGWALGHIKPTPENTHKFHERNTVVRGLYFADRALAGEKAEGWRVPDGWREAFEDCYMRANEVGILHRDDGEYTSVLTKVAWALWNERARLSPIDWWHASHDSEARAWTIHSPSGDSCEVHERAAGPHAEILRQLAQSLPTPPTDGEE